MTSVITSDHARIFYKDWGPKSAQPIVFHHGWPACFDRAIALAARQSKVALGEVTIEPKLSCTSRMPPTTS